MRTEQTDKASSCDSWPKCYRLSNTESILLRAPGTATTPGFAQSPLRPRGGALPSQLPCSALQRWKGGGERGEREGLPEEATMWFQLTLSAPTPLLPFLHSFSFPTGKSVSRSGSVFLPLLFLPNPGPSSRPGASWWGARWKPLCSRERGARGRFRGGTWLQSPSAHPEAPRPVRPRSVGCAPPSRSQAAAKRGGARRGHRDDPPPPPLAR